MSDDGILSADVATYGRAAAADSGPPAVTSDPLVEGGTPVEQLLRALGLAANSGDPLDDSAGLDDYANRDAAMAAAAEGFASQDSTAGSEMSQLPQLAAGIAGALVGVLAGALQPVMQMPAQLAQGAGQALQAGTALMSQYRDTDSPDFPLSDEQPDEQYGGVADDVPPMDDLSPLDTTGSGTGSAGTAPMALLGPAPIPSATTAPASAAPLSPRAPAAASAPAAGVGGMAGMPMIPPGPMSAAANTATPPETKRVAAPTVRNGAPVQGRIAGPPAGPLAPRTLEGRPVEARRIVLPSVPEESGGPA